MTNPLTPSPRATARKLAFRRFAGLLAAIALGYATYSLVFVGHTVHTDNAYVGAEVAQVTALVAGIVQEVRVTDTQSVTAGDVLVLLDPTDTNLALTRAKADVAVAATNLDRAQLDWGRRDQLTQTGAVSREELSNAENALKSAQANMEAAKAALAQAEVNAQRTTVRAPVDGIVAARRVQMGQYVQMGMPLLSVVPLQAVHVEANFKEAQLREVRVGQPATLTADLYGKKVVYHGKVEGIAGGTGSAFALIPAQNATGNWIKVVQRLPVRIALDPTELALHPLQVGLSMEAVIDTTPKKGKSEGALQSPRD